MKVVAVVQARAGSTRLPGKVLMDVAGRPMLVQILRRVAAASRVDEVVLATSDLERDDPVAEVAASEGFSVFRGSEQDVLARFAGAARAANADVVVRITGDCPLIAPEVIDEVVARLVEDGADYASNVLERTFPKGLDTEALTREALERIDELGTSPEAREHVTWFAYRERPDLFRLVSVEHDEDHSGIDWSVDTEEDLQRVRELYERFGLADRVRPWAELLDRTDEL
jgi:spore coat polysaccharide biosynthesis protein SpsF